MTADAARHHEIGEQEIDRALGLLEQRGRARSVLGLDDLVPPAEQPPADHRANLGFVLDDEHRLAGARREHRPGLVLEHDGARHRGRLDLRARQEHAERRAFPDLRLELDAAVVLLDDAEHRREAEAGALADVLGREERLEDVLARDVVDAGAVVDDREADVVTGRDIELARELRVDVRVRGLDDQLAAFGHRVARVDHEVREDLLDLARVRVDAIQVRLEVRVQRDVLPDDARQHLRDVADDRVELEEPRLHGLLPAERQQLPGQRRGAIPRVHDLREVGARGVILGERLSDELGAREDDREDVVEVVGDAARELTDRLELLGLAQLFLELARLGDIHADRELAAATVEHEVVRGHLDVEPRAVVTAHALRAEIDDTGGPRVVRVAREVGHEIEDRARRELLAGVAEQQRRALVDRDKPTVERVEHADRHGAQVEQQPLALERLLELRGAHHHDRLEVRLVDHRAAQVRRHLVERAREASELVVRVELDPALEVSARERVRLALEVADRAQEPARQREADEAHEEQHGHGADRREQHQPTTVLLALARRGLAPRPLVGHAVEHVPVEVLVRAHERRDRLGRGLAQDVLALGHEVGDVGKDVLLLEQLGLREVAGQHERPRGRPLELGPRGRSAIVRPRRHEVVEAQHRDARLVDRHRVLAPVQRGVVAVHADRAAPDREPEQRDAHHEREREDEQQLAAHAESRAVTRHAAPRCRSDAPHRSNRPWRCLQ